MTDKKDIFRTLTPEEYEKVEVLSREEIREALEKGRRELMLMQRWATRPGYYR